MEHNGKTLGAVLSVTVPHTAYAHPVNLRDTGLRETRLRDTHGSWQDSRATAYDDDDDYDDDYDDNREDDDDYDDDREDDDRSSFFDRWRLQKNTGTEIARRI